MLAQGNTAQEISSVAIDILKPFAGKNILVHPTILHHFADQFLQHFIRPSTVSSVNGRVFISITQLKPYTNIVVNHFHDQEDLCRAIRASCHIPSIRKRSVRFRGKRCIDGGFTNNSPIPHQQTLRISPFFFERAADITPSRSVAPWRAIQVPSENQAQELFQLGEKDALAYLEKIRQQKIQLKKKNPVVVSPFPFQQVGQSTSTYSVS